MLPLSPAIWSAISGTTLDLACPYGKRFSCEQLFCNQQSVILQLQRSGLREPKYIDRMLLVVAIAVLVCNLHCYKVSLAGERRRIDRHWKHGLSFARIALHWLQRVIGAGRKLVAWIPISLQALEPSIPSRGGRVQKKEPGSNKLNPTGSPPHGIVGDRMTVSGEMYPAVKFPPPPWLSHGHRGESSSPNRSADEGRHGGLAKSADPVAADDLPDGEKEDTQI